MKKSEIIEMINYRRGRDNMIPDLIDASILIDDIKMFKKIKKVEQ